MSKVNVEEDRSGRWQGSRLWKHSLILRNIRWKAEKLKKYEEIENEDDSGRTRTIRETVTLVDDPGSWWKTKKNKKMKTMSRHQLIKKKTIGIKRKRIY